MELYEFKKQIHELRLRLITATHDFRNAIIKRDYGKSIKFNNDIVNIIYIINQKIEDFEQEIILHS